MSAEEFAASPVVNVESTSEYRSPPTDGFHLGQLWPVGCMEIVFHGNTPFSALAAQFPEHAHVDVVGIKCSVDWTTFTNSVRELLNSEHLREAGEVDAEGVWETFCTNVDQHCVYMVHGIVRGLKNAIGEAATSVLNDKKRTKTESIWMGGLDGTLAACDEWSTTWRKSGIDARTAKSAAEKLIEALNTGASFVLPGKLSTEGQIDQAKFVAALRGSAERLVRVDSVIAPFTSEREPGTQGKRSSLILGLLATILLGVSIVDLSWLPKWWIFSWIPEATMPDATSAVERAESLRESLVALLLIFPAALYGQFFQLRPTSLVGHRAQSGTFAALSALFALPIIPAALIATGSNLAMLSVVAMVLGALSLFSAVIVGLLFSGGALERVRVSSLIGQIESDSKRVT